MSQAIDTYLEKNLDRYVQETVRLCAQPSISATSEGTAECAVLVAAILKEHGYDVQTFKTEGNPVIIGHLDGTSDKTLLFYNHYDVQPVDPLELWETPPFEPDIRDNRIYARGSKDDKGEIIARLAAVDAVREAHSGKLRAHLDQQGFEDVEVENLAQMWPHSTDATHPFLQIAREAASQVYDLPLLIDPMNGGSSPMYAFSRPLGGIPLVWLGVGSKDNNQAHSPNEWVGIDDLHNTARYIARIVDSFADMPE